MLSRLVTGQVEKFLISYSLTVFVTAFQVLKIVFERFDSVAVYKISDFLFFFLRAREFIQIFVLLPCFNLFTAIFLVSKTMILHCYLINIVMIISTLKHL